MSISDWTTPIAVEVAVETGKFPISAHSVLLELDTSAIRILSLTVGVEFWSYQVGKVGIIIFRLKKR